MTPPTEPGELCLDCRGQRCPLPVITLARHARGQQPGSVVIVLADDHAARADIPAWCRLKGHRVEIDQALTHSIYRVTLSVPDLRAETPDTPEVESGR